MDRFASSTSHSCVRCRVSAARRAPRSAVSSLRNASRSCSSSARLSSERLRSFDSASSRSRSVRNSRLDSSRSLWFSRDSRSKSSRSFAAFSRFAILRLARCNLTPCSVTAKAAFRITPLRIGTASSGSLSSSKTSAPSSAPSNTRRAPESPALATTTSTLGSDPHGSICNTATHAVVPPSMAAPFSPSTPPLFGRPHHGMHDDARRGLAGAESDGNIPSSDDCGLAAPSFLYDVSRYRKASVQHISNTAPRLSAPWSSSARSMWRST
mmetsp:Transcript_6258/g.28251  ORF Transcript_6258/g.28251 Transcript_6258/m.28251 type:complete len:268 (-) Transcript_6258:368-1171(-)